MDIPADHPPLEAPPCLDSLPLSELIECIGRHDLPTLIFLAASSKSWQQRIYRDEECRHLLWKEIDFSKVEPERTEYLKLWDNRGNNLPLSELKLVRKERLDDASLAAFLRRIDARNVTEYLNLAGCKLLTGTGLEPLRESTHLRELDLRFYHDDISRLSPMVTIPDSRAIMSVLLSMPPFVGIGTGNQHNSGLKIIKHPFLGNYRRVGDHEEAKDEMEVFMKRFQAKLAARLKKEQTECGCCNYPVYERIVSSDELTQSHKDACSICQHLKEFKCNAEGWGVPLREEWLPVREDHHRKKGFSAMAADLLCYECKSISCGQNECPETRQCYECKTQNCTKCLKMTVCGGCGDSFCGKCKGIKLCDGCNRSSECWNCEFNSFNEMTVFQCSTCPKTSCAECGDVRRCEYFEEYFCTGCKTMKECSLCNLSSCTEFVVEKCSACKGEFCQGCCEWHEGAPGPKCEICDKHFCLSCSNVGEVDVLWRVEFCDKAYCTECRPLIECDDCDFYCDSIGCRAKHRNKCTGAKRAKKGKK